MKHFIKKFLFQKKSTRIPDFKNTEDKKLYMELKTVWDASTKIKRPQIPDAEKAWINLQHEMNKLNKKRESIFSKLINEMIYRPAISYAFAVLLIIGFIFYFNMGKEVYQTKRGELLTINLPDQTKINLNCESTISYNDNFNDKNRTVSLKGEAYFNVMHSNIPFIVKSDIASVQVTGTEFNVKIRNDLMEVAVNQGEVKLFSTIEQRDSTVILKRGTWSTCRKGAFPEKPLLLPFKSYPGWINNELICDKTPLRQVCQEIERRFDIAIYFEDKELKNKTITGIFLLDEPAQLLSSICKLISKEYKYENGIYFIF